MRSHTPEMSEPCRSGDRGFTLLEIMIAVAIIAVGLTSLLGLHGHNIKNTLYNQQLAKATLLARDIASDLQFRASTQGIQSLNSVGGKLDEPGFRFEVEVSPTELDSVRRAIIRVVFDERAPSACELVYFVSGPVG